MSESPTTPLRVLLLTQYFPPEIGAPQVIHSEWIPRFVARGHTVYVVTCFPNYPSGIVAEGYRGRMFMHEELCGAQVYRTFTWAAPNSGVRGRLVNQGAFAASAWMAYPKLPEVDVVVTQFPPLLTALSGIAMARMRGVPHVLNMNDLSVEAAVSLGMLRSRAARRVSQFISDLARKMSEMILATTPGAAQHVVDAGIPRERVRYLPNSVDTSRFTNDVERRKRVRAAMGWQDKTVILYHGTHGRSQGLGHVLDAAALLADRPDILFVFIGDGAEREGLARRKQQLGLSNLVMLPSRPPDDMPGLLNACDIGLVCLRDIPVFERTLPSKLLEFMASETPTLLGVRGGAREIIEDSGGGFAYEPENPAELAACARRLAADRSLRIEMGQRARVHAVQYFCRDRFTVQLEKLLHEVVARAGGAGASTDSDLDGGSSSPTYHEDLLSQSHGTSQPTPVD